MKTGWKILLICAGVIVLVVAGIFAYNHFITDQIRDKGGMENPNSTKFAAKMPSEGAQLIACFLTNSGMSYDDCYSFNLWQQEDKVLFSADYPLDGSEHIIITEKVLESTALARLRALVLTLDLTQTPDSPQDPDLQPLDGNERHVTLTWEDGTEITPDAGFYEVKDFFVQLMTDIEKQ